MQLRSLLMLLAVLLLGVLADTFYDDLGVGQDADEATIKKVRPLCARLLQCCLQGRRLHLLLAPPRSR
jgi:hypothetical protein